MNQKLKQKLINWIEAAIVIICLVACYYFYAQYKGQQQDFDKVTRGINEAWQKDLDSVVKYHQLRYDSLETRVNKGMKKIGKHKSNIKHNDSIINLHDSDVRDSLWKVAGFK